MKDIKNYEGLYAITSCGKVWSYRNQRFLKPETTERGYLRVALCRDGTTKHYKIHRLVAEAYIPNPEGKPQVNHIDEVKTNNYVNNLEWATAKENNNHGTRSERSGKNRQKVVYCVELDKTFESQGLAALATGIAQPSISLACNGRQKTAGGYHWKFV